MVFRTRFAPSHTDAGPRLFPQFLRGHAPYAARLGTRPRLLITRPCLLITRPCLSGGPGHAACDASPPSYVTTTTETRPPQVNVARTASR